MEDVTTLYGRENRDGTISFTFTREQYEVLRKDIDGKVKQRKNIRKKRGTKYSTKNDFHLELGTGTEVEQEIVPEVREDYTEKRNEYHTEAMNEVNQIIASLIEKLENINK